MTNPRALPTLTPRPRWRGRDAEEHGEALVAVCRAAVKILESQPDGRTRLATVDRVPSSTRAILRRLARRHG
ncbi:MAG: hypothetical protein ACREQQ_18745 [Candidatus Binatia bacterium]